MTNRQITLMDDVETAALIEAIDDLRDLLIRIVDRKTVTFPDHDELGRLVDCSLFEELF